MLAKIEKTLSGVEEAIIFLSIISSLILVFINILLRFFFSKGFVFSEEYARYSMVLLVYIGVSQAIKKDTMIRVDILSHFLPKSKFFLDISASVFSMIVAFMLFWFGLEFTIWQYSTGQTSIGMELPMWIAFAVVPMGALLMLMRYLVKTIEMIKK